MDLCGGALRYLPVGLVGKLGLHLRRFGVHGLGSNAKGRVRSGGLRLRRGGSGLRWRGGKCIRRRRRDVNRSLAGLARKTLE